MRRLLLVLPLIGVLLGGCTPEWTDQEPLTPAYEPAVGFHTISYHGISIDVPESATIDPPGPCGGGLPATGDFVVPVFFDGEAACPAMPASGGPPPPARPSTELTVTLGGIGMTPSSSLTDPRVHDVDQVGVRVIAAGPDDVVTTVLASIRVTEQDENGCKDRVDPNVAPRNIDSPDGSLLPVATRRIVVCEYGQVGFDDQVYWLAGSVELPDDKATALAARLTASTEAAVMPPRADFPHAPVLRLLVLGADGNTRTLAVNANGPNIVTDGQHTVHLAPDANGDSPVPTPFYLP